MGENRFSGPSSGVGPGCSLLGEGAWITSGRTAVLEGPAHLAVIDPGDEDCGSLANPTGPLADVLALVRDTGKPLRWVLVTHSHPDHVGNLDLFRLAGEVQVVAHAKSPVGADLLVFEEMPLAASWGVEAIPTPGHSARGDDLTFWAPGPGIVFPGDLIQPKGETWETTFYPSPWVHFVDGGRYLRSLARISRLPFATVVTGHREIRRGEAARRWVDLTTRSIEAVAEAVAGWSGPDDLAVAGPAIYRALARQRGLPQEAIDARLASSPGHPSPFERYDLPGIAYYWERREGGVRVGGPRPPKPGNRRPPSHR